MTGGMRMLSEPQPKLGPPTVLSICVCFGPQLTRSLLLDSTPGRIAPFQQLQRQMSHGMKGTLRSRQFVSNTSTYQAVRVPATYTYESLQGPLASDAVAQDVAL
jgi:hypothetical protein